MSAAFLLLWGPALAWIPGQSLPAAELVVVNANVITVQKTAPRAEAFAVSGGRFLAVGSTREVEPLVGKDTLRLDLANRTIVPGFNDAHAHPSPVYPENSPLATAELGPESVRSMDDLIAALRRKAEKTPAGQPVIGRGYHDTKLGRHPTRHDLDQASVRHPIYITHSSGHVSVANSLALRLADVSRSTPDPRGGAFDRDAQGEPNGVCRERAASVVRRAAPEGAKPTMQEAAALLHLRARRQDGALRRLPVGANASQPVCPGPGNSRCWHIRLARQRRGPALEDPGPGDSPQC